MASASVKSNTSAPMLRRKRMAAARAAIQPIRYSGFQVEFSDMGLSCLLILSFDVPGKAGDDGQKLEDKSDEQACPAEILHVL